MKPGVRADWARVVLVCGKCCRKMDGGFGDGQRQPLDKALRKHLGLGKGRRSPIGIVEVKCLGVCPRNSAVLVDAARPQEWRLVPRGAALDQLSASIGLVPDEG